MAAGTEFTRDGRTPTIASKLSTSRHTGECHPYLRLFSRLVGHDQVSCPSSIGEGRQSLPPSGMVSQRVSSSDEPLVCKKADTWIAL